MCTICGKHGHEAHTVNQDLEEEEKEEDEDIEDTARCPDFVTNASNQAILINSAL